MIRNSIFLFITVLLSSGLHQALADTGRSPRCLAILKSEGPRLVEPGVINTQGVELFDFETGWLDLSPDECLAIIRRDDWIPRGSATRVHLNDGQVFTGSLINSDSEVVMLDHLWMRELAIPLEHVTRIDFRPGTNIPEGETDRMVLVNGDQISGFIEQVGNPTIIETDNGQRIEIPADRVAAVALMNETRSPTWPQVWTVDGLRMTVPRVEIDDTGRLSLAHHPYMKGQYERMPRTSELVALVLQGDRFVSLAELPVETTSTESTRRTATTPRKADSSAPMGLTDLYLNGPASFTFDLPIGAKRLRTTINRPQRARDWSSPAIRISVGDDMIWQGEIDSDHPVDLELPAGSRTLVIEILCGVHGPIHCGVTLTDPMIMK